MINESKVFLETGFLTFGNSESDGNIIKDNTTELRDYFAAAAISRWVSQKEVDDADSIAIDAYKIADAMLRARKCPIYQQQGK